MSVAIDDNDVETDYCFACGEELTPSTAPLGVIYVREEIDGRFVTVPICEADFALRLPGWHPTRLQW